MPPQPKRLCPEHGPYEWQCPGCAMKYEFEPQLAPKAVSRPAEK